VAYHDTTEAMEIQELLEDKLATRDLRGAVVPRADTVAPPEEWGAIAPTMVRTAHRGPRRI
jgi:hypothetical protein